jgi:hypothetical protein
MAVKRQGMQVFWVLIYGDRQIIQIGGITKRLYTASGTRPNREVFGLFADLLDAFS